MNTVRRGPPDNGESIKKQLDQDQKKREQDRERKAKEQQVKKEFVTELQSLRKEVESKNLSAAAAERFLAAYRAMEAQNPDYVNTLVPESAQRKQVLNELDQIVRDPSVTPPGLQSLIAGVIPTKVQLQELTRSFSVGGLEQNARKFLGARITKSMIASASRGLQGLGIELDVDEEQTAQELQGAAFDLLRWVIGNILSTFPIAAVQEYGRTIHERMVVDQFLAEGGTRAQVTDQVLERWRKDYAAAANLARTQKKSAVAYPTIQQVIKMLENETKTKNEDEDKKKRENERIEKETVTLAGLRIPPEGLPVTGVVTLPQYGSPQREVKLDKSGSSHRIQVGTGDQRITIKMGTTGAGEDPDTIRIKRPDSASALEDEIRVEVKKGTTEYVVKLGAFVTAIDDDRASETRKQHAIIRASDRVELQ